MPLGTLDRTAPPLFNQGQSALSKLIFFGALSLFLMVADARFHIVQPIRATLGAVLYPVQWVALKPVQPGRAAEVLYDAADPYTRKIVIDQGLAHGVAAGSPVIDAHGVLGQVTQVLPLTSEVTLVIDRDLAIPVQNTRTGVRSVAFGDASAHGGGLELRFMAANADLQEGDLLSTSGVDGIYPAGLPVAKIERIERRADSAFARIYCVPLASVTAARYVLVLEPTGAPTAPPPAAPATTQRKRAEGKPGAGKNEKKPAGGGGR
jgi:rod shape-determining protein MreC